MTEIKRPQLEGIQILRAIGVFWVLAAHIILAAILAGPHVPNALPDFAIWTYAAGKSSLDFFFVISGFIMVYISRGDFEREGAVSDFIKMRISRVVPIYWFYTTLMVILATWQGKDFVFQSPVMKAVLSYLFIPYGNIPPDIMLPETSTIYPVHAVGWTLNYEAFFYILFGLMLVYTMRRALLQLAGLFFVLALVHPFIPESVAALHFWTSSLLWKFMFGAGIGYLYVNGFRLKLSPVMAGAMMLAGFTATALLYVNFMDTRTIWFHTATGLCASLVVAGVTLSVLENAPWPAWLVRVGDASYSTYLSHLFIVVLTYMTLPRALYDYPVVIVLSAIPVFAACVVVGDYSYRYLELPLTRLTRQMLMHRKS